MTAGPFVAGVASLSGGGGQWLNQSKCLQDVNTTVRELRLGLAWIRQQEGAIVEL